MPMLIADDISIDVPEWVTTLEAFRRWTDSTDFPEKGNIWWLRGKVWADMSKEQVFTHVRVKTRITTCLDTLVTDLDLGTLLSDGLLLTNTEAGISGNPDLTFFSHDSLAAGNVSLVKGRREGYTEVQGSPDMVLEVVSPRSELKDLTLLRDDYFKAGVREYWIVDARAESLEFDILKRSAKGFVETRKQEGWLKSVVFGRSFRLVRGVDRSGNPQFTLEVK